MTNLRILSIALFLGLVCCTSDDQATAKSTDSQPAQEQTQETQPAQVAQNDQPAEPETKTITTYHFTSSTEHNSIDCEKEGQVVGCGVNYDSCGSKGEDSYACQSGVHEWSTSREQLVK